MDVPRPREDVLAQPTRARLVELLAAGGGPMGTRELADRLGLHPNGVRAHLDLLRSAGLIERRRARRGPGRPRDEWAIAPGAAPGGEPPQANRDLVRWLVKAIPPTPGRLRQLESAGREIGRGIARSGEGTTATALGDALTSLGFRPTVEVADDGRLTCTLGNCPYRDAARENQHVVCALHRGMTRGLLDTIDPAAELAGFVPSDPDSAGCRVEVRGIGRS